MQTGIFTLHPQSKRFDSITNKEKERWTAAAAILLCGNIHSMDARFKAIIYIVGSVL